MIRVLIVDDEPLIRSGLRTLLAGAGDLDVVGDAASGDEAVRRCLRDPVDVVVLDIHMPEANGLAVAAKLTALPRPPRVLILTNLGSDQNLLQALDAGASGFVLKTAGPDCIISAVRLTAAGGCATMPDLVKGLLGAARLQSPRRARTARARLDVLSDRQREILALVARGDSNARIGRKLGMTEGTVKTYLSRILTLIHAENRTQAALLMYDAGFTDEVGS